MSGVWCSTAARVNEIEAPGPQRRLHHVALDEMHERRPLPRTHLAMLVGADDAAAQIHADHFRVIARHRAGQPPVAAPNVEHQLAVQRFGRHVEAAEQFLLAKRNRP